MDSGRSGTRAEGCPNMCGMCPACVFASNTPSSPRCLWRVSDESRKRFIVGLILKCRSAQVLENIQTALSVTSWPLLTYARSRRPTFREDDHSHSTDQAADHGKPLGVGVKKSSDWSDSSSDWFDSSSDWLKLRYLFCLLSRCDLELLRMVANLTSVLLIRHKRGFLLFNGNSTSQHGETSDEDSEDPALMVVPGSSKSMSGVSRYKDFVGCLPVTLSKRILGLLDARTLTSCQQVCQTWQRLAKETSEENKFRRIFQYQIKLMVKKCRAVHKINPTYAKVVDVPVPAREDEILDATAPEVKLFKAAYAKVRTKTVQMEERNVFCGAYFTKVLLSRTDPHRVTDYRGGSLMAISSKDHTVHLLRVASETKVVTVLKGHVRRVRAVLLCEDRGLVVTAGCDLSIRCWSLKTDACVMVLSGHTGTVNCLDVHADSLVSGARDCLVKVWRLNTGTQLEDVHFKHPGSVQCVKITVTRVYSSCTQGLVKVWDVDNRSLLRVINAHRSSVKCLFLDDWHILSGDSSGQVMAWSVDCDVKPCLGAFSHPKEVTSLALIFLRVVTGCADGKIRIFNFLTGECLRDITAETGKERILCMHFHDNSILVNTTAGVNLYQFAKVFWEYSATPERGQGDSSARASASLRTRPFTSAAASSSQRMQNWDKRNPQRAAMLRHTSSSPGRGQGRERHDEESVKLSEKATNERIKRRGPHHPLTRDAILLRVSTIQKAQRTDEVSVNMEHNARLRDSWGPHTSQDPVLEQKPSRSRRPKTCVPILRGAVGQNVTTTAQRRVPPHSAGAAMASRLSGFTYCPKCCVRSGSSLPRIRPAGPFRVQAGFQQVTGAQLEDCHRAKRDVIQGCEQKRSKTQLKPV